MLVTKPYDRDRAVQYAERWAFDRNPLFANFSGIGGDCTNFISQSVYAGSCQMNFTPEFGWYYMSSSDRTASWTGVEFFYNFMVANEGVGPYASEVGAGELDVGDVIQLGRRDGSFYHTLLVVGEENGMYLVAAHSDDAFNRRLDTYNYARIRFLHIEGVRIEVADRRDCFENLINGISL
ncbi:MAG: amidase [Ruminococcaceae bacterium]|nr:amidase [Oscillospiraceae bacterium]